MTTDSDHRFVAVIAGGVGSQLWPLSRAHNPKQFLPVLPGGQSLFQHMIELLRQSFSVEKILVVGPQVAIGHAKRQFPEIPRENLLVEPARRDNYPAILLAVLTARRRDSLAQLAVVWSDHVIENSKGFLDSLSMRFQALKTHPEHLITFGTTPNFRQPALVISNLAKEFRVKQQMRPLRSIRSRHFVKNPMRKQPKNTWNLVAIFGIRATKSFQHNRF